MKTILAATVASTVAVAAGQARASTFAAWQVTDVPFGDTLNVRKYPAATSQKQSAYPNGAVLQMTGRCTGGADLRDIANLSDGKQRKLVRYRWCEVWHEPARDGSFVTGWVYGRYIAPY